MKTILFLITPLLIAVIYTGCKEDPVSEPEPEKTFEVTANETAVEFAFDEVKELGFSVTGDGAVDLSLEVTVPEGWVNKTTYFAREGEIGYKGVLRVTAPHQSSEGKIEITVTNKTGVAKTAHISVSANSNPLEVNIEIPGEQHQIMEVSESKSVSFTVSRNNPVELTAEVSATNDWTVIIEGFTTENIDDETKNYYGSILITSPDEESETEITISIKNSRGDVVKSAMITAECNKIINIVLDVPVKDVFFGFGETRTSTFTVKGKDATDLTASVEAAAGWIAEIGQFEAADEGYAGTIIITAPETESSDNIVLTVTNGSDITLTETIHVTSAMFRVNFEEDRYEFDFQEVKTINYTVTGLKGPIIKKSQIIYPNNWRQDPDYDAPPPSFEWNEENARYEGSFRAMATSFPEDNILYVRLTDESDQMYNFPLDVICGGGTPVPTPKSGANCIVISQAGDFSFDAKRGDGVSVSGKTVKMIWTDRATQLIDESSLKFENGQITLKTAPAFNQGNVLIALFDDSDNIVWSWHLWLVSGLNLNSPSGEFLNMNVGATSSSRSAGNTDDYGLMFQWGRKEPFPGPKERTGRTEDASMAFIGNTQEFVMASGYSWNCNSDMMNTHEVAARYPTTMVEISKNMPSAGLGAWGPVSDPCPKGWRVPTHMELWKHWDFYDSSVQHPNGVKYEGINLNSYPNEWWPTPGTRMTNTGISTWRGALRQTGYGYYWSSTSTGYYSPVDPDEDMGDEGYLSAAGLDTGYNNWVKGNDWKKCHAASVRCIKE